MVPLSGCKDNTAGETRPPIALSVIDLAQAYEDNEVEAQQKFGKRPLIISGNVSSITLDFMEEPVVGMRVPNLSDQIEFDLAGEAHAQAARVKKGQKLTLHCGSISEIGGQPYLYKCRFPVDNADGKASDASRTSLSMV